MQLLTDDEEFHVTHPFCPRNSNICELFRYFLLAPEYCSRAKVLLLHSVVALLGMSLSSK